MFCSNWTGYDQQPQYEPPGSDVDERPQYRDLYRPDQYGQYSLQNVVSNNNTTVVSDNIEFISLVNTKNWYKL
jgi:hypothetical protein